MNGQTPLFYAISKGNIEIVKYLIGERGADILVKDCDGRNPYYFAKEKKQKEIAKYISTHIESGCCYI